jgi:predicted outer membrane lipoprotein
MHHVGVLVACAFNNINILVMQIRDLIKNSIIGFGNKIKEKREVRKEREKEYKTYIEYI